MEIERIEPIPVRLPMTAPVKMASETIEAANNLFVRIEAEGVTGWGEAASSPTLTGELVEGMAAAARLLGPFLVGRDARDMNAILAEMDARLYGNTGAKAAIDMALHDLVGKADGKPVHALLGEQRRNQVPALWILDHGDTGADVAEAVERQRAGFTAFKIKVGIKKPDEDIARTGAICAALGPDSLVLADANEAWTVEQAIAYVSALTDTSFDVIEQPVPSPDLAGMAEVRAASRVKVGADEGLHGPDDLRRHHVAKAADGASLKTIKFGGLGRAHAAAVLCDELGLKVNLASTIAESSLGAAALVHLAAAIPSVDWRMSLTNTYLAKDITDNPISVVGGLISVPAGPGLGIHIDENLIETYRLPL